MTLTLLVLLACILIIVGAAFRLLYVLIEGLEEDGLDDEPDDEDIQVESYQYPGLPPASVELQRRYNLLQNQINDRVMVETEDDILNAQRDDPRRI